MPLDLEPGDYVVVRTVNGGVLPAAFESKRKPRVEIWSGRIVQASPLGAGWWLVKKNGKAGKGGGTYTVPDSEITKVRR